MLGRGAVYNRVCRSAAGRYLSPKGTVVRAAFSAGILGFEIGRLGEAVLAAKAFGLSTSQEVTGTSVYRVVDDEAAHGRGFP